MIELASLTWEAHEPMRLARFWGAALGWDVSGETGRRVEVKAADGSCFGFAFVRAAPASGTKRMHLDLSSQSAEDQHATVARLVDLGAREADVGQGPDAPHVVLADPEGNELCVLEPGNRFVTYASRVGCLVCDGSRDLGVFWGEALGWPLVWDRDGETAIRAPGGGRQFVSWGGPPVAPKTGKNRLHLDVAPAPGSSQGAEVERLLSLGARRVGIGQGDVAWVVMADPDDNEFCVIPAQASGRSAAAPAPESVG